MDVRDLDLNLLLAFDALLQEGSVTHAATRLGVSQPAMSQALARMRSVFGDPLFVRVGNRMSPTPEGSEIGESVRRVMRILREDVLQRAPFDPASAPRQFNLCMTDVSEFMLAPALARRLADVAPAAELRLHSLGSGDLAAALASGEIDLALGLFPELPGGVMQQKLFETGFACIARQGNPFTEGGLTLHGFCAAPHVAMKIRSHQGLVQRDLRAAGIQRNVKVTVQHFHSLGGILAGTDMIAVVPADVTQHLAMIFAAEVHPLPYPSSTFTVRQHWHERYDREPGRRWLRRQVEDLFRRR